MRLEIDRLRVARVTPEEAEYVVRHARLPFPESTRDGKFRAWGQTLIHVIHARDLEDREKKQLRRRRNRA